MPSIHKSIIPVETCTSEFMEFVNFDWSTKHRKFAALGVYVLDLIGTPYCKIGSTGAPVARLEALRNQTPFKLSMPFFVTGGGGLSHIAIEQEAKESLSEYHVRGEWFRCANSIAIEQVRIAAYHAGEWAWGEP